MSERQLIPNAVGRLDDVVEALADGDCVVAEILLVARRVEVGRKYDLARAEAAKHFEELNSINAFIAALRDDEGFRERARLACGGGPSAEEATPDEEADPLDMGPDFDSWRES